MTAWPFDTIGIDEYHDVSIGSSKAHLSLIMDTRNEQIRCELYIPDNKELFAALQDRQKAIDEALDYELEWMELPGKKASRIKAARDMDVGDSEVWETCFEWLLRSAECFHAVFSPHIRELGF